MSHLEEAQSELAAFRATKNQRLAAVDNDPALSDVQKQVQKNSLASSLGFEEAPLIERLHSAREQDRDELERAAFKVPTGQEERFRQRLADAQTAAGRPQLVSLLREADRLGDQVQRRAILYEAFRREYWGLLEEQGDAKMRKLVEFERANGKLRSTRERHLQTLFGAR